MFCFSVDRARANAPNRRSIRGFLRNGHQAALDALKILQFWQISDLKITDNSTPHREYKI